MRLLLDTHILLWWLADDASLPARADALIADHGNGIFVSPMSLWEIAIKAHLGKIEAEPDDVRTAALESGFLSLPFTLEHAVAAARGPDHHRDPFDRALVAQAQCESLRLLTHDRRIADYGENVLLV